MKRKFTFLIAAAVMLLTMVATTGEMWGQTRDEEVAYTLEPASGSNNSYAGNCDITISGITWNLTGNSTYRPWRIGGKSLSNVDRTLYSKTAITDNISKIEVTHREANNITINSWTVIVSKNSDFTNPVSTLTPSFAANSTTTINRPDGKDWSNCYYKFVYNVTVSGSNNKFLEFSQAQFYKEDGGGDPSISADNIEIAYNATAGEIAYTINNPVQGGQLTAATESDWISNITVGETVTFTCSANPTYFARMATVTLTYTYNTDETVNKNVTVTQALNPEGTGSLANPFTIEQAREFIDGLGGGTSSSEVHVGGMISQIDSYNSGYHSITYWISDDGTTTNQLEVFGGKGLNGADFNSVEDLVLLSEVVVKGTLKKYNDIYEFNSNSQIVSLTPPAVPTITAENVNIDYDATAGEIVYTINNQVEGGQLSAATESDWLALSNNFASPIAFTCSANEGANARTATVTLTYTYNRANVTKNVTVTQAKYEAPNVTWDLSIASYDEITDPDIVTWSSSYATMTNSSKSGGTSASNYLGGDANNRTSSRFYSGNTLTISPAANYVITSIVFTATSANYANALKESNWTNASAAVDETTVSVTPTNGANPISAIVGGTCGFTAVTVYYVSSNTPSITLASYSIDVDDAEHDGTINVTYKNVDVEEASIYFCDSEGEATSYGNWIQVDINNDDNVYYILAANTGNARTAYFKVYSMDDATNLIYSDIVTVNQAAYIPTYTVNFTLDGGTFVPNADFASDIVEKEAGTYNLPSATKTGWQFIGWNDGSNTYQAGEEYTVSADVNFTAQWTQLLTGTINFGSASGSTNINAASVSGDDSMGNNWTITTVGTTSYTPNAGWAQVGSSSKPATSITFTTTLAGSATIADFKAKFGGYSGTAGTVTLKVGETTVGTGSLDATNDVVVVNSSQGTGTTLTVTVTDIAKGVKCYYISFTILSYDIYGSTEITNFTIPVGETLTIHNGAVLEITGTLTNNGDESNLVIEDGGQLIHNGNVNATLKKNVAASPTWGSRGVSGWYTIASPVADMAVSCATTGDYDFFAFNEENTKWLNQKVGANNITNFEQGVGYLYANADATVIDYLGTLIGTETEVTKPLSYACENASYQGINLMGNPFSRNLVAGDIEIAGTPLTTYYTVEGGNELTAKTLASTPIKPGQGFMVQATASSQNLVFNPTSKDRSAAKVGYISIVAGNSEFTDNAFVQVGGGNTLHKMTLSDNSSIVYVMNNGNDYAAATIDALEGSMPVCFKANALGSYTITIEAIDINADYLHLIDNFTGEDINLLLEPSYSFIASNGDRAERFTLVFRSNGSEGTTNDIFAFQNGSDIIVNGEGELQVFDVTGRMVATQHVNGVQTVNVPSQGVFIFKLNEKTQKIVVR